MIPRTREALEYGTLARYWNASVNGLTMKESSNVNGPSGRSNRTLPVLIRINLGLLARVEFTMVKARASANNPVKILPGSPNGLQVIHQVFGAHPIKAVKLSCCLRADIS